MTINLSDVTFDNNFFEIYLPTGELLILNSLDESIAVDGKVAVIDRINISVVDGNDEQHVCSSVIGMGSSWFDLTTDYPEYMGKELTRENMRYCVIEVSE